MEKVSIKLSICNDYNIVLPPWYPPLSNQKERNKQSNGKWKLVMKRLIDFPLTFPIKLRFVSKIPYLMLKKPDR